MLRIRMIEIEINHVALSGIGKIMSDVE